MQRQKDSVNLMTFIKPHQSGFLLSIILAVISVTSGIVPYFAVARIVNLLIGGETNFSTYLTWGIVALIAYLMKSVFHGLSTRCSHEATFHVLSEIRQAVADKLTRVSMGYLTDTPSGRLKTTMVERVEQMEVPLAHIIPEMTSNLLVPIAIIIYLFVLDWRMALVSLITIPIGMLCYMAQMKEYPKKYGAVVQASKYMSATTVEYINGIEVIKAFNQSAASYGKFTQAVRQSVDLMLDWMKSTQGYSALMMTIWPAVLIGVLPIGCVFYRNGSLTAPDFITIAILSLGIVGPLVAAIFLTDDFSKIATITGEIGAVLSEPDLERPAQRKELHGLDIDLRNVTFAYKDKQVLNGVTLNIRQGTTTALVGPSGSGKSTIAKLIASYWDAGGGSITIGGVDIRRMKRESLRRQIGLVLQEPFLFSQTVGENICAVRPDAGDEAMRRAAAVACVDEASSAFPQGYDTVVGERGVTLSGGQKQRVAIAGVIAMEPECIVLDEATAMLDPSGRREVLDTVHRLNRERGITVVHITHHMSEAEDADRVIVMNDGVVAMDGAPREIFSRVEELQALGLAAPDTVELLRRLNRHGMDLPLTAITVDECARAIFQALHGAEGK